MIQTFNAFLDFCYLVRRNIITEDTLNEIDDTVERFHKHRVIFQETGVRPMTTEGFSLPRQHSILHYNIHIRNFGAPNGLCSSITESKHIEAVKKPWRRSNRYEPIKQMLLTNERLDKLSSARIDFRERGMFARSCLAATSRGIEAQANEDSNHNNNNNASNNDDNNNDNESNGDDNENDSDDNDNESDNDNEETNNNRLGLDKDTYNAYRECGPVDGPMIYNEVVLSRWKGVS
jgi:hypothetical protein